MHNATLLAAILIAMPHYQSGFSEDDFERLKTAIEEIAKDGPFDANDVLFPLVRAEVTNNAGDVATALDDLADLGYLRPLGGDPPRWERAASD
ncbi:MAG TPA: hypothetical protein VF245_11990 [Solirubrobacterales bacterium]